MGIKKFKPINTDDNMKPSSFNWKVQLLHTDIQLLVICTFKAVCDPPINILLMTLMTALWQSVDCSFSITDLIRVLKSWL